MCIPKSEWPAPVEENIGCECIWSNNNVLGPKAKSGKVVVSEACITAAVPAIPVRLDILAAKIRSHAYYSPKQMTALAICIEKSDKLRSLPNEVMIMIRNLIRHHQTTTYGKEYHSLHIPFHCAQSSCAQHHHVLKENDMDAFAVDFHNKYCDEKKHSDHQDYPSKRRGCRALDRDYSSLVTNYALRNIRYQKSEHKPGKLSHVAGSEMEHWEQMTNPDGEFKDVIETLREYFGVEVMVINARVDPVNRKPYKNQHTQLAVMAWLHSPTEFETLKMKSTKGAYGEKNFFANAAVPVSAADASAIIQSSIQSIEGLKRTMTTLGLQKWAHPQQLDLRGIKVDGRGGWEMDATVTESYCKGYRKQFSRQSWPQVMKLRKCLYPEGST